jgi:hypothetical protein
LLSVESISGITQLEKVFQFSLDFVKSGHMGIHPEVKKFYYNKLIA